MERNVVLSLPQVTVDYTFMLPGHLERVCAEFVKRGFFDKEDREELESISTFGLQQDRNRRLRLNSKSLPDLGGALEYLRTTYPRVELAQIGGNPAISALRGHYLG